MEGFITSLNSGVYTVFANQVFYPCKARGLFRLKEINPIVGDDVVIEVDSENKGWMIDVKPRKNQMIRPSIANVDQILIVVSLSHPKISLGMISRYIIIAASASIQPIIIINKVDRDDLEMDYLDFIKRVLTGFGYQILTTSTKTGEHIEEFKKLFNERKTVITGQSGVGKSSLLNAVTDHLTIKTNEISVALGRGKHTTRIIEYYPFLGGFVADTPGFSYIDFPLTATELAHLYPGFAPYINKCKFRGCLHDQEIGCKIKEDLSNGIIPEQHYQDYIALLKEIKSKKEY